MSKKSVKTFFAVLRKKLHSSGSFISITLMTVLIAIELCTTPGCFVCSSSPDKPAAATDTIKCIGSWQLIAPAAPENCAITLNILPDGSVNGFAGVNSYQGQLTGDYRNGTFKLDGSMAVTMRMGHNMAREEAFLTALHQAGKWQITDGNTLELTGNGQVLLRFTRQENNSAAMENIAE